MNNDDFLYKSFSNTVLNDSENLPEEYIGDNLHEMLAAVDKVDLKFF